MATKPPTSQELGVAGNLIDNLGRHAADSSSLFRHPRDGPNGDHVD